MIAEGGKPGLPARNREFLNRKLIRDGRGAGGPDARPGLSGGRERADSALFQKEKDSGGAPKNFA